ncbi:MAG TPA: PGPGW domain-containing protein [Acidimicrobiales bacterium]|nr:PGPGW domain-containing protein [Acidimicrobiales bacterium]
MAEPPLTDPLDRPQILDPDAGPLGQLLDDAVEAEIELRHQRSFRDAERGLVRRAVRVVAGFTLVVVGILLLVMPGPGLIVVAAGLGLLSRDVPFARRWLAIVRSRIPEGQDGEVAAWVVYGSATLAVVSVVSSVVWLLTR